MILHEDFVRCPDCGVADFRKNEYTQLNKEAYGKSISERKLVPHKTTIEYVCRGCGRLMGNEESSEL